MRTLRRRLNLEKNTIGKEHYLLVFLAGLAIRSIPNLVTPYPIGFDTLHYITQILDWRRNIADPNTLLVPPLAFLILALVHASSGIEPSYLLRTAQPFFYGFLAVTFYHAGMRLLNWTPKKALLGVVIFSLQTATLRISWDLLRNELGLAILLLILPRLKNHQKGTPTLAILSTLVAFSHQTTSVILLSIAIPIILSRVRAKEYDNAKTLFISIVPSALLLTGALLHDAGILNLPTNPEPSVFTTTMTVPPKSSYPFPFVNYLADYGQPYTGLLVDVASLYVASYLLILPLVVVGFRRL